MTTEKRVYLAFYGGRRLEVEAQTAYEASRLAAERFRATKAYHVTVMYAERDGQPVTHRAGDL